ncbi:metal-dependent transcriptional regulator [Anaerostipes sp.]|uniref:metal-dependent transcriptional regulator n=1 Tax=Anaerostipes sp. TaxID=1872530 RepID=UPI0025B86B2D|nr:metal-dependent transcriptional regulator [Anaerostipes sp.]MBS7008566.1 metal-dependent transcriptional regulator [Anaerostipes sp.]
MLESRENYLEAILMLKQEIGQVRSIDIARKLNYSKASVSRAVGILKQGGYITVDGKGYISLTSEGLEKAEAIYERHKTLTSFFMHTAGVPEHVAEEDACRCEHVLSKQTFHGIKMFLSENSRC